MAKPFPLQPLRDLAQHQKDSATLKLGQLNQQQQSAQQKLEILQEYRRDYQARLQQAAQSGMDPAELRNFQQFINKLDEAIRQQLQLVEQSKLSTQKGRSEFDSTQRKLKSFDTLQQRHMEQQNKLAEKSEQKAQDEHTGRLAAYKMLNEQEHNQ